MISSLDRKLLRDLSQMKGQVVCDCAGDRGRRGHVRQLADDPALARADAGDVLRALSLRRRVRPREAGAGLDRRPARARCPAWRRWKRGSSRAGDARRAGAGRAGRRAADFAAGDASRRGSISFTCGAAGSSRSAATTRCWPARRSSKANELDVGDSIVAIINGRRKELRDRRRRVLARVRVSDQAGRHAARPEALRHLVDGARGARQRPTTWTARSTTSTISLQRGASVEEVIYRVDRLLEPYGVLRCVRPQGSACRTCCWRATSKGCETVGPDRADDLPVRGGVSAERRDDAAHQLAARADRRAQGVRLLRIWQIALALHEVRAADHDGRWGARHAGRHVARARLHEDVPARVPVSGAGVPRAAERRGERGAGGRRGGDRRRVRRDRAGRAPAAGRSDAARAAGPLRADDSGADRPGAARAERGPHDPAAARAASGEDVVLAAGDRDVGGDRRGRQLHAQLGRQGDSNAISTTCSDSICRWRWSSRCRSTRSTSWPVLPGVFEVEPRRIDRGAAAVAEPLAARRHHGPAARRRAAAARRPRRATSRRAAARWAGDFAESWPTCCT